MNKTWMVSIGVPARRSRVGASKVAAEHRGVGILIAPLALLFVDAKTRSRTLGRVNNAEEAWV